MTKKNDLLNSELAISILLGGILYYVWMFTSSDLRATLPDKIGEWLLFGSFPFFIVLGHYLMSTMYGGAKATEDIRTMKMILFGFMIWLIYILITLIGPSVLFFQLKFTEPMIFLGYDIMILIILVDRWWGNDSDATECKEQVTKAR